MVKRCRILDRCHTGQDPYLVFTLLSDITHFHRHTGRYGGAGGAACEMFCNNTRNVPLLREPVDLSAPALDDLGACRIHAQLRQPVARPHQKQ